MQVRADLEAIWRAGVAACDPAAAVQRYLQLSLGDLIVAGESLPFSGRLVVIAAGKAAPAMAEAAAVVLGDRVWRQLVVAKDPGRCSWPVRLAGHPRPDERSVSAAAAVLQSVSGLTAEDVVLVLLSGGASALLGSPRPPLTLADIAAASDVLLASGADIHALNTVRKQLFALANGGLAQALRPARVVTLALSDVPGDRPDSIGSGPTVPDQTTRSAISTIVDRFRLKLLSAVAQALAIGHETVHTSDPRDRFHTIGSNLIACQAAQAEAERRGYLIEPAPPLTGEARRMGDVLASRLITIAAGTSQPRAIICGGETTVSLGSAPGIGGRNQELALAAAIALDGSLDICLLAAGTDGGDGSSPAAGAFADGSSVGRAARRGRDARHHLIRHDAYGFFQALDDAFVTGPTGTNVMDLVVGVVAG